MRREYRYCKCVTVIIYFTTVGGFFVCRLCTCKMYVRSSCMRGMAVDFQMFFGIKRTVYKNRASHYLLHSERQLPISESHATISEDVSEFSRNLPDLALPRRRFATSHHGCRRCWRYSVATFCCVLLNACCKISTGLESSDMFPYVYFMKHS